MIYYKYQDEYSPIGAGMTYVETDERLAYRQITVNGEKYLMSNIDYPEWGPMLAEGEFDPRIEELEEITKQEFDAVWTSHLVNDQIHWSYTKRSYPVGMEVTGYIRIFYPQGVIVNLEENRLGVANYSECKATAKREWM
jgi:hypothetical protein